MLERLLRPRTVAVIGGGTWCTSVIEQCRKIGFDGPLWAVHPSRKDVAGVPTVPRIEDLPEAPDAAFVGINRDATVEVVRVLAALGAGGAVCFASGFGEAAEDGAARQAALLEAAGGMTVLGPNCYGFINSLDGFALWPDQHGCARVERGVALVMQSSNVALNMTMQRRGVPLAYLVTVGNQAQTGLTAVARTLLSDPRVTAVGLYIEGIDDLRGLEALAAEAWAHGKSVVALKIGRSAAAQAATVTHTASLSGSAAGASALFRRLGIGEARSLPVLLEALKLLHVTGPLRSARIASMSCSGGEASLMADMAEGAGLTFPSLSSAQSAALRDVLGPMVALANPLDYHTFVWGDEDRLTATFTAMMQEDLAMGCVILDLPRSDRCDPLAWEPVIGAVARTKSATGRAMAIIASLPETMPEGVAERLIGDGIVPLAGMGEAVAAMSIAAGMRSSGAEPLILPPQEVAGPTLHEAAAKAALSAAGLPVPAGARAASPAEAAEAAASLRFPVALKGDGHAHKTEAGAVALSLSTPGAVAAAAEAMAAERFLVEEMVTDRVAELLVGVVADPAHGYVLTLAAGGVLTEVLSDSAVLLLPATRTEVATALGSLRIAKVLSGYRGAPPADLDAVLDAVMAVQEYVAAARPLEVEINPLICGVDGAVAVDALIRRTK
ncbi:MAG: acetate--CoA ligase family protein [Pseudomonadota bacterium]